MFNYVKHLIAYTHRKFTNNVQESHRGREDNDGDPAQWLLHRLQSSRANLSCNKVSNPVCELILQQSK